MRRKIVKCEKIALLYFLILILNISRFTKVNPLITSFQTRGPLYIYREVTQVENRHFFVFFCTYVYINIYIFIFCGGDDFLDAMIKFYGLFLV